MASATAIPQARPRRRSSRGAARGRPGAARRCVACVLPFLLSDYRVFQFTLVLVYAIALLGLNMLTGYNGQISLGHGAFYAIGAYTAAILMDSSACRTGRRFRSAGAVCFVVGFLFGLPALRLEGLYLALATFALGVAMPQILKYKRFEHWTGGVQGIVIVKPDAPFGSSSVAGPVALLLHAGDRGRAVRGRLEPAARPHRPGDGRDPRPADRGGGDGRRTPRSYKSLTFGVSAMYTGIAGALGAIVDPVRRARQLHDRSCRSRLLVGIVVGGLASISGRVLGACSSSSCPTSPTRSPRRRRGRSTASS